MPTLTITDYVLTGVGRVGVYVQLRSNSSAAIFTSATATDSNGQFSVGASAPPPDDYAAYTSPSLVSPVWTLYDPHFRIAYTKGDDAILTSSKFKTQPWVDVSHPDFGGLSPTNTALANTTAIHAARDFAGASAVLFFPALGVLPVNPLNANVASQTWQISLGCTLQLAALSNGTLLFASGAGVIITGGGSLDGNRAGQTGASSGMVLGSDTQVSNLTVQHCFSYGVTPNVASRVKVVNVFVSDTGADGIGAYCQNQNCSRLLIADCVIDRSAEPAGTINTPGINIVGVVAGVQFSQVQIRDCQVLMPVGPTSSGAICIQTYGNVARATLRGNECSGGSMGLSMDHTLRSTATANVVYNVNLYCIELATSSHNAISANGCDGNGLALRGIVVDGAGSTSNAISGNAILGMAAGASNCAISVSGGADRTAITGNVVSISVNIYILNVQNSTRTTITGNTLDGGGVALKCVFLDTSDRVTIMGNEFSNVVESGIIVYAATAVTLRKIIVGPNVYDTVNVLIGVQLSGGATLAADCNFGLPTSSQAQPGNPAGTVAGPVMAGLAGAFTPFGAGRVLLIVSGDALNNTAADGGVMQIRYGTGAAPINGAAVSGTAVGSAPGMTSSTASAKHPFSVQAVVAGLILNTTYWIDLSILAVTGGTFSIENISVSVVEF